MPGAVIMPSWPSPTEAAALASHPRSGVQANHNDAGARFVTSGQSAIPGVGTNFNSNGFQVGVRHSF